MKLFILFPFCSSLILFFIFYSAKKAKHSLLEAIVQTYIIIFLYIAASTELLSLFQGLSLVNITISWGIFIIFCSVFLFYNYNKFYLYNTKASNKKSEYIIYLSITSIILLTLLTALVYPPTTWDSMTYHMARIPHWIENKSVDFYHTSIPRQNYQMPLAEYAILHLQILTNCDIFANLVQWISFCVLICLSSLVSASLGLNKKQQLIAAVATATLPMAIVQASGTQNDLVVSAFIMASCYYFIKLSKTISIENSCLTAISLGLACLTKGTAYLICIPMSLFLAIQFTTLQKKAGNSFLKILGILVFIISITVLINSMFLKRMYFEYGKFTPDDTRLYKNEELSYSIIAANILRNMALHIGVPSTRINHFSDSIITSILQEELNNSKSTWPGTSYLTCYSRHEDSAGNLLHFLLAVSFFIATPLFIYKKKYSSIRLYSFGILSSFLFFCIILKWQPWASRLHTPLFTLSAPLIVLAITEINTYIFKYFEYLMLFLFIVSGANCALRAQPRSLISLQWLHNNRNQLYFIANDKIKNDYFQVINAICLDNTQKNINIGIDIKGNDWEYPFWIIAKQKCQSNVKFNFRHIYSNDISQDINNQYILTTQHYNNWKSSTKHKLIYNSAIIQAYKLKTPIPSSN